MDKKQINSLEILLAPITPNSQYLSKWSVKEPGKIVGTWAEDGNEYIITCPPQLTESIVALQSQVLLGWKVAIIDEKINELVDQINDINKING